MVAHIAADRTYMGADSAGMLAGVEREMNASTICSQPRAGHTHKETGPRKKKKKKKEEREREGDAR